jgi:hypothetical protein
VVLTADEHERFLTCGSWADGKVRVLRLVVHSVWYLAMQADAEDVGPPGMGSFIVACLVEYRELRRDDDGVCCGRSTVGRYLACIPEKS